MKITPKKTTNQTLHFSTRSYPTFGRSRKPFDEINPPKTVTDSPYYWWFMFLRLNSDYKATCDANGKGKHSALYKDFGNVYKMNFKEWWQERAHLFSEPKKGYKMKIAGDINDIAPFNDKEVLNLVVPLTWSQRSLKKGFSQLVLKLIEKGKRGVSVIESEATYKLSSRWNIEAFKNAYDIYVEKQKSLNESKKVAWADIAIRANIQYAKREKAKEGIKNKHTVDIRATLTVLADRHYKPAQKFISSATTKEFPH
jgi:hypothetical protein